MIDIKRYVEKKEKGLVSIAKIGDAFAISAKRFDPETGEEIAPEVQGFSIEELEKMKTEFQKAIASVDVLIKDAKAL